MIKFFLMFFVNIGQIEGEVKKNPKSRRNFPDAVVYLYLIAHIIHIMGSWARVRLSSSLDWQQLPVAPLYMYDDVWAWC